DVTALLQEDALRAGRELLPDAHQILPLELRVEILREAVAEAVIGGLVALEPERDDRELDRERETEEQRADDHRRQHAGMLPGSAHRGEPRRVHRPGPPSRKLRSSSSATRRFVARDFSFSSVYRRSILSTNAWMS